MSLSEEEIEGLNLCLDESALLGLDIDELSASIFVKINILQFDKEAATETLLLYLKNTSRIVSACHVNGKVRRLSLDQLKEMLKNLGGSSIYGSSFFDSKQTNPEWMAAPSLDYKFSESDCKHTLDLFQDTQQKKLDLRIYFNDLDAHLASDSLVSLTEVIRRNLAWWQAFNKSDPKTQGFGILPLKE